jgi:putative FmdB family regulatory protein
MPSYEFTCATCGQTFEKQLSMDADQSSVRCPSGHRRVHRLYSAPPVMFKGSGFYITDHQKVHADDSGKA